MALKIFAAVAALLIPALAGTALGQAPGTASGVAPMAAGAAASPERAGAGYILGPDDEIQVSVYGQTDMSTKVRIRSDGAVSLPFLGRVVASGMTTAQFADEITREYVRGGYLTNPSINVEVSSFVSRAATVLGNVLNAGNYPLDRGYSVATLIARAGGVRADGANLVVVTHTGGSPPERIRLADADAAAHVVQPGDTLFVPPAEMVYVYGQVNQPGAFPFQPGMTYRQALARAGGPTLAGSTRKIEVRRGGKPVRGLSLDDELQPEDVLLIKEKLF